MVEDRTIWEEVAAVPRREEAEEEDPGEFDAALTLLLKRADEIRRLLNDASSVESLPRTIRTDILAMSKRIWRIDRLERWRLERPENRTALRSVIMELTGDAVILDLKVRKFEAERGKKEEFRNVEFRCIEDYDKCRKKRGHSGLCRLALMICILRRIVPMVR